MAGSIYFDVSNYSAGNGKQYFNDIYLCNYPMSDIWLIDNVNIEFVNGSKKITLTSSISGTASFYDLYGGNTNTILKYPYILTGAGTVVKIKQILSSTTAILEREYPAPDVITTSLVIDYFGQPAVQSTVIGNNSDATESGISIGTEFIFDGAVSFAPAQTIEIGTDPIALYMDGVSLFMLITF